VKSEISSTGVNIAYEDMYRAYRPLEYVIADKNLKQSNDTFELEKWVAAAIAANPKAAEGFRTGNEKALNAIMGAVMKASAGKANPKLVDEIVRRQLGA
jgi:aspartyl-tRNA(Asn)/glutamyl-tRNA(Gln) amidotransferase subunit B